MTEFDGLVQFDDVKMSTAAGTLGTVAIPAACESAPNMPSPYMARASRAAAESASKCSGVASVLGEMGSIVRKRALFATNGRVWASPAPTEAMAKARIRAGLRLAERWRGMTSEERLAALGRAASDSDIAGGFAKTLGVGGLMEAAQMDAATTGRIVGAAASPNGDTGKGSLSRKDMLELFRGLRTHPFTMTEMSNSRAFFQPDTDDRHNWLGFSAYSYNLEAFFGGLAKGAGLNGPQPVEIGKHPSHLTLALIDFAHDFNIPADPYSWKGAGGVPHSYLVALSHGLARSADDVYIALVSGRGKPLKSDEIHYREAVGLLLSESKSKMENLEFIRALGRYQTDELAKQSTSATYLRTLGEFRVLRAELQNTLLQRAETLAQVDATAEQHARALAWQVGQAAFSAMLTFVTAGGSLGLQLLATGTKTLAGQFGPGGVELSDAQTKYLQGAIDADASREDRDALATALVYLNTCANRHWPIPAGAENEFVLRNAVWRARETDASGVTVTFERLVKASKDLVPEYSAQ